MAVINIAVYAISNGTFRIWARNEDDGRVCSGRLTGTFRGLAVSGSNSTLADKRRQGYETVLRIEDDAFVVRNDRAFKSIIGLFSGALLGSGEHTVHTRLRNLGVDREYLNQRLLPGLSALVTIFDLHQIFEAGDNDAASTPAPPYPGNKSACAFADSAWNF